ncbi:MAG: hypothetical protein IPN45_04570 [Actinomycetales bacterium]|nr:hypothetical protein [Actinomycetales bacterium]
MSETGPAGYVGTWSCVNAAGDPVTVNANNGITVALAQSVTCTVNNDDQTAHLKLVKTITNNNGGTATVTDWTLTATGPTTISGITGTGDVNQDVNAGSYTLSETGPAGYVGTWSCVNAAGDPVTVNANNGITVALAQSVTCTVNNDDQPAHLNLVKKIANDNGGTLATVMDVDRDRPDHDQWDHRNR